MAANNDERPVAARSARKKPTDKPREPGWWQTIRTDYCEFDRRTLGFTRLLLGFYLIFDLLRRSRAWWQMFSDEGVLPNHLNLFRPQAWGAISIVNAFSTRGECWVLFGLVLATYLCLFVGYKTKLAQVLALVWVTGMNGRVLLIENGGYVVQNLLLLWTCFLPLGDRFSLDALLRSMKRTRETGAASLNDRADRVEERLRLPHVSVLGIVLCIQTAAIYYFNVVHKTGPAWHNGTAVHYVLYVDRMATPLVAHLRDYVPNFAILFMTKSALTFEATIPICMLSPLARVWAKRAVIFMMNCLHIAFGVTFVLGPFAWALCVWSTLFFSREDWELAYRTMRRTHRARTVAFDPRSGAQLFACRLLKRFDTMELLTFREEPGVMLTVERAGGERVRGAEALADLVAVVPPFAAIAWTVRLPVLRSIADALWGALERRDVSRFFGLETKLPKAEDVEPTPLGRKARLFTTGLREVLTLVMFVGAVNQALVELWCVNRRVKVPQPEVTRLLSHKLRFLQGWFMFSPNPVMDDGTIVVDAVTVDGRHIDPFWAKPPNFDLLHAKSFGYDQIWSDYFNRMHLPGNSGYRDAMKEYMYRLPERTGNPNDAIVSGDVYWVQDMNPRWNEKTSWKEERLKLFSFENPKYPPKPPAPAIN